MRRSCAIIAFGFAACCAAGPAFAQNVTPRQPHHHVEGRAPDIRFIQGSSAACECRAHGRVFLEGDSTCLNGIIAYCDMDQNVTTWRRTSRTCPQS